MTWVVGEGGGGGAGAMFPAARSAGCHQALGGAGAGAGGGEGWSGDGFVRSNVTATTAATGGRVAKSHSEAERRRRQRINAHLSTLRALLPNTTKMDKASLLTEVVRQVRELRRYADDAAASGADAWSEVVPGESDEVRLDRVEVAAEGCALFRASVCCEDRPGLMAELGQALRSVQAKAVRAEMVTVGGRTRSVLVLEGAVEEEERAALHAALRAVVHRPGLVGSGFESRRLRFARAL